MKDETKSWFEYSFENLKSAKVLIETPSPHYNRFSQRDTISKRSAPVYRRFIPGN